ncbi:beta-class carbonic anhydrase [Geomesophilobacter sediminis]|uniref:Carbonic anhydrase n=1 Tax=Geomesophilobacter sediminis TaxID=2798584 RepID=A0A8J7M363_9BACT|nr:carbonic anhydrase [Geomesophilobacter sediminis]MBJ6727865.1 carbonic anhydrase [Geomesophilobacter sediminis]
MAVLDDILKANQSFIRPGKFAPLPKNPQKQIAIFTCMDTRLVDFLEPAMGIQRGEAKVIKNAGNTVIDPNGGVIRSLVAAIFMLGVEEVLVVGHKDCGMSSVDAPSLKAQMIERGIDPQAIETLVPDLAQWLGAFDHPEENVERVVSVIRQSPLIPKNVPIHGLIFCPTDGHLEVVVEGYQQCK